MRNRTIDEATARELSVKAECDPRTLRKVLKNGEAKTFAAKRAKRILVEAGLLQADKDQKAA